MAGLIPQGFIDDLLERVPVAEIVRARIDLKKSGTTYKACCPFHNEKTPSFHVNTQKNFYHCFGCGANGNAINFLREFDNLSFTEAVEELAKIAGVEVPRDERVQAQFSAQRGMLDALEYAQHQYRQALSGHADKARAEAYLSSRGLSSSVIERFGIGFAPAQRDYLWQGANPGIRSALIKARLISDRYDNPFELFQDRLMFPIRNPRGRVVAFGGRTLSGDKAKYINSPESEVFHKSHEVYGLYEAMQANRQLEQLLVVEGYMDVVSLAQYGIDNAVATLGTATNNENLSQLLSRCPDLVFCFDGDAAGLQAARKAMENALPIFEDGMRLSFLLLPQGEDPDTLVRKEGKEAFAERVRRAKPLSEFFFQIYSKGLDLSLAENRGLLKQRTEPHIEKIQSAVLKSALRKRLNQISFQSGERRERGKPQGQKKPHFQQELSEVTVVRDLGTAYCLALLYKPACAEEVLKELESSGQESLAYEFARYVASVGAADTEALLFALATDQHGMRARFWELFDRLDWVPNAEQAEQELQAILVRQRSDSKRATALQHVRSNKLPSQMSEAEKRALKSISTLK